MIAPFFIETQKKTGKIFCYYKIKSYLCIAFEKQRALSSAGSEHLPYKQRVGGSNPSAPTLILNANIKSIRALSSAGSEHLPYKQRVGGSNPSAPTSNREKNTRALSSAGSEHLPYKQRVGGSNPSAPTKKEQEDLFFLLFLHIVLALYRVPSNK